MEKQQITEAQQQLLDAPLPAEAVSPHPTKSYLSAIKGIYVTERLNKVFGVGAWRVRAEQVAQENKMIVVKVTFEIPAYDIYYECYGGNDNADLGDAFKGATTDALTKIGSWLGIGAEVFKGLRDKRAPQPTQKQAAAPAAPAKRRLPAAILDDAKTCDKFLAWMYGLWVNSGYAEGFDAAAALKKAYDADPETVNRFANLFNSYRQARNGD